MAALTTGVLRAAVPFYPPTDLLRMDEQMPPGAAEEFAALVPGRPYGHDHPAAPPFLPPAHGRVTCVGNAPFAAWQH
jgi:hypothetical protein